MTSPRDAGAAGVPQEPMSNAPTDPRPAPPALRAVETVPTEAAAKPAAKPPAPAAKPAAVAPKPVAPAPKAVPKPAAVSRPVAPGAPAARFRFRHFAIAASFLLAVLLPLAASVYYLYARAADQYHSETAFSVRSEETGIAAAAGLLGALTQVGSGSASDTDILFDFIRSQEIVEAVDARLDLRTHLQPRGTAGLRLLPGREPVDRGAGRPLEPDGAGRPRNARRHHPRARQRLHAGGRHRDRQRHPRREQRPDQPSSPTRPARTRCASRARSSPRPRTTCVTSAPSSPSSAAPTAWSIRPPTSPARWGS